MDDIKNLNNEFSFIERLAQYYSDFLSTDFKKVVFQDFKQETKREEGQV